MNRADKHNRLAMQMLTGLPLWASWATSFRDVSTPYGAIGFRQASILWSLRMHPGNDAPLTPSILAQRSDVQPSVMTRALDKLEAGGFIARVSDPIDKRRVSVSITDQGTAVSKFIEQIYQDELARQIDPLTDEELDHLLSAVEVLRRMSTDLYERRHILTNRDYSLATDSESRAATNS